MDVREICLEGGFSCKTSSSSKERFKAICYEKKCLRLIKEQTINSNDGLFQVIKLIDEYTCSSTHLNLKNRQANKTYWAT